MSEQTQRSAESYRAKHVIEVSEPEPGVYHATEPGVDVVGRGASPPEAICNYATMFMDCDTDE
jgi:hypothetical protein